MISSSFDYLQSIANASFFGMVRGGIVNIIIHPLDVIKTKQQVSPHAEKTRTVVQELWQKEGLSAFYKGFYPQMIKTVSKQCWCWPVMVGTPVYLERYFPYFKDHHLQSQLATGLLISSIHTGGTAPFEKAKIKAIVNQKNESFFSLIKKREGWQGITTQWLKVANAWTVFLVSQQFFKDKYCTYTQKKDLTLLELSAIGVVVAGCVSTCNTPLERVNAIQLSSTTPLSTRQLLKEVAKDFFKLSPNNYRGWQAYTAAMVIQNVTSTILIDRLSPLFKKNENF